MLVEDIKIKYFFNEETGLTLASYDKGNFILPRSYHYVEVGLNVREVDRLMIVDLDQFSIVELVDSKTELYQALHLVQEQAHTRI